jgi:hypothetical protein
VTLKFDKAPLKEVLAEITRQSGVAISTGAVPQPFDAAKYRAIMEKLPRYAELPEEERKQLQMEFFAMEGSSWHNFTHMNDPDLYMRQYALNATATGPREWAARIELAIKGREEVERATNEVNRTTVSLDVANVTALAAIDAIVAAAKPTRLTVWGGGPHSFAVQLAHPGLHDDTHIAYSGRMRIAMSERNCWGQRYYANDAWKSTVQIAISVRSECGFDTCDFQSLVGTDQAGRKHTMQAPQVVVLGESSMPDCTFDLPEEVQAFVSLTGELKAMAVTEQRQHRLPLTVGSKVHNDSHVLTIAAISKADGIAYLTLRFTHKDPAERSEHWDQFALQNFLKQVAYVELADGKQVGLSGTRYDRAPDGSAVCHTFFKNGEGEPAALVFNEALKKIPITIPFEFKNVKLP